MSEEEFLTQIKGFTCFPEDIQEKAISAAALLNDRKRAKLADTLRIIHEDCARIEMRRLRRFEDAMRSLGELRRNLVPRLHAEVESHETAAALTPLEQAIDDSPAPR